MGAAEIDGTVITTEYEFHRAIKKALDFGPYYGHNLDALHDAMSDVPRPVTLIWRNSVISKLALGRVFEQIVEILRAEESHDQRVYPPEKQFRLVLE
jgi:ribonuclease inhibitor